MVDPTEPEVDVEPPVLPDDPGIAPEPDSTNIGILDEVERVDVPYPRRNYWCPACRRDIPTRKQRRMGVPAEYEHLFNQVLQCPFCRFFFSPKHESVNVIRQ